MDVLSEVLRTIRLKGSIFFKANLYEPWSFITPDSETMLQQLPDKSECISLFHIITEGEGWFSPQGSKSFVLQKGSVIIFPHCRPHKMSSEPNLPSVSVLDVIDYSDIHSFPTLEYGKDGKKTQFICGYLLCDQRFNPLLGAIPEVITLMPENRRQFLNSTSGDKEQSHSKLILKNGSWLDTTLQQLTTEVDGHNAGSETIINKLTELLYVEILRRYMKELPPGSEGWLAGLKDPQIGKALKLIHKNPEQKWNVSQLAREVGVSRSAFARRFTEMTGQPPIRYLTNWRMQLAQDLLLQAELNVKIVAQKVGYESDIAFNRAFKRHVGKPPAHWRAQRL